jgi:hypothetical protein
LAFDFGGELPGGFGEQFVCAGYVDQVAAGAGAVEFGDGCVEA